MPTYSYKCDACGHQFEQCQALSDEPVRRCPSCGRKRVRRLIGAGAGLIFKGSGFYITDYVRSKGNPSDKSAPETSQNGGGGKEKTSKGKTKSSTTDSKSTEE